MQEVPSQHRQSWQYLAGTLLVRGWWPQGVWQHCEMAPHTADWVRARTGIQIARGHGQQELLHLRNPSP